MTALSVSILELRIRALHCIARLKGIKSDEEIIRTLVQTMNDSDVLAALRKINAAWWTLRYWGF